MRLMRINVDAWNDVVGQVMVIMVVIKMTINKLRI